MRQQFLVTFAAIVLMSSGCQNKPTAYPVDGRVEYKDGSPVPGGTVEFQTKLDDGKIVNARGVIGEDGSFQLTTFEKNDGALAGKHTAIIVPPPIKDETVKAPKTILSRYMDYSKSGLQFEVEPKPNKIVIKLDKP